MYCIFNFIIFIFLFFPNHSGKFHLDRCISLSRDWHQLAGVVGHKRIGPFATLVGTKFYIPSRLEPLSPFFFVFTLKIHLRQQMPRYTTKIQAFRHTTFSVHTLCYGSSPHFFFFFFFNNCNHGSEIVHSNLSIIFKNSVADHYTECK
ncbi:unnamed protein product [Meganyctiphanes norvegica]|uniref:Secreted protein n=1 Tax=Meganyctiphanes norvegica TaxID=48144 RepID=A0AAV2SXT5_MEGNR